MRMAAVRIRAVKKLQAMVVAIAKEVRQSSDAKRRLVRTMSNSRRARPHRQPACLNACTSQSNRVRSGVLLRQRGYNDSPVGKSGSGKPNRTGYACSSGRVGGSMQEFSPFHDASSNRQAGECSLILTRRREISKQV